ncbi:MAG TPA: ABC transporter permease [Anaerolineales bacterium]|nr:ABC transporter permease [Anaerolineales bacterium]
MKPNNRPHSPVHAGEVSPAQGMRGKSASSEGMWRLLATPLLAFFLIPVVLLFTRTSPEEFIHSLNLAQVRQAIGVSMRTTVVSVGIIVGLGTPLAYWLGRYNFRFKRFVDTLIDLPTILPPSVAGVALLITFGRRGLIGGWLEMAGVQLAFTQIAVVMAQVFIATPFFIRTASVGFRGVEYELEEAAQLDGANRWQVFRYVILPLSQNALISGGMMSWARALGEFGATILFAGNLPGITQTMPTAIYLGFEVDVNIAVTLSVILVLVSFGALWLVKGLLARLDA